MAAVKILIAGNDAATRQDLRAAVQRAGYEVVGVVSTGADAIRKADFLAPDLAVVDVELEDGMDGIDAAGEIYRRSDIPVICLAITDDAGTRLWTERSGPLSCLLKPLTHAELKNAVEVGIYTHRLKQELRSATQAAEAANRAKTAFLATVSHELRTPMNGVLGLTELLLMADPDDASRESLLLIKDSALGLLSALNQILDYSNLQRSDHKVRMADFRIEDLVAGVLSRYDRAAKAKGITLGHTLSPALPGWLRGDLSKLRQILGNLVNNAVKFTAAGHVLVDVSPANSGEEGAALGKEGAATVEIRVQDSGAGIPPERLDAIFDSFSMAHDHLQHSTGALGLGLAIVSNVTATLGGSVSCESCEGTGSTFTVRVPLQRSGYEELAPSTSVIRGDSSVQGTTILVVEDDLVNQRYIVRLLEKMECDVTLAEDGIQAVDILKSRRFDMVFMDVEMPRMNGIEATRTIRDPGSGCLDSGVPIIALTAHAMWGDQQRCIHAGMDDYLSKPVEVDTMAAIIQSIVGNR